MAVIRAVALVCVTAGSEPAEIKQMTEFAKIDLSNNTKVGDGLPPNIAAWENCGATGLEALSDPETAMGIDCPAEFIGYGWWPIVDVTVVTEGKQRTGEPTGAANAAMRQWEVTYDLEDIPVPVPAVVAMWRGRIALDRAELLDAVDELIAQQPREVQIRWQYAVELHRDDALLNAMAVALGLTSEQVDDLFRVAAAL
jgi:hypothetical protein